MNIKLLQLNESHDDAHEYPEALFVMDGQIDLLVDGKAIAVHKGGLYIVPPGAVHSVATASDGTAVIFE